MSETNHNTQRATDFYNLTYHTAKNKATQGLSIVKAQFSGTHTYTFLNAGEYFFCKARFESLVQGTQETPQLDLSSSSEFDLSSLPEFDPSSSQEFDLPPSSELVYHRHQSLTYHRRQNSTHHRQPTVIRVGLSSSPEFGRSSSHSISVRAVGYVGRNRSSKGEL